MPRASSSPPAVSSDSAAGADRTADEKVRLLDAVVRAIDRDTGGQLVASVLEDALVFPARGSLARTAAVLARDLRLTRAIPALVHCLEHVHEDDPLLYSARKALEGMGNEPADALLDAFHRWTSPEIRLRLAGALLDTRVRNELIFDALVQLLDDDPWVGPEYVQEYGGPDALKVVSDALDRAVLAQREPINIFTNEDICALARAVRKLGGSVSPSQQAKLDEVLLRRQTAPVPWDADRPRPPPAIRGPVPGRNAPCHCGSGRKYKKCHLDEDSRGSR
jgi:hypothetical protein